MTTLTSAAVHCGIPLATEPDEAPWCERCRWNLDAFEPGSRRGWIARRVDRMAFKLGYRMHLGLHHDLLGRPIERPGRSAAKLILAAISGAVLAAMLLLIALGTWLIIDYPWPAKVAGALIIGIALLLRPRVGRLKPVLEHNDELTRQDAPHLFALIDRVAVEAGTPSPHRVVLNADWNAFAGAIGPRQRRVLGLGLPLFGSIRPQERVALLGHEMGHFANGDLRAGLMTRPALDTFGVLADLLYPDWFADRDHDSIMGLFVIAVERAVQPLMLIASHLCMLVHIGVNTIGARDSQRAEYYADELAARVGGTRAALGLMDVFAADEGMTTVVGGRSRAGEGVAGWREGVEQARERMRSRMSRLRQLTLRKESSILRSHPPSGLRYELLAQRPYSDPRVVLTDGEAALIDAELARYERRYRLTIAHDW